MLSPSSLHFLLFYLLITLATIAQAVLKATNARFRDVGEEKRRLIAFMFAVLVAKMLLFALLVPVLRAIILAQEWDSKLATDAVYGAHLMAVTYLFDMIYRRVNILVWVHHTLAIGACLVIIWCINPDVPDVARVWLSIPTIFAGIGVGITDLGGDVAVLLFYLAPQIVATSHMIHLCAQFIILGRVAVWSLVFTDISRGHWRELELNLPSYTLVGGVLLCWGWAQLDNIYVVLGLEEKVRSRAAAGKDERSKKS
ncbi:hypothetical protein MVEN_01737200 [Mycena venus]|uniref:TLC domain-containing protein n=1 Tax=Mycena venus TaxID=2733690 RepID=A0A8H6XK40_9AGAR|nr:hypothetical protein MVEN_01737200 [Mycena venus]